MRNSKVKESTDKKLLTRFHLRQNLWSLPEGCGKYSTCTFNSHFPVSICRSLTVMLILKRRRVVFAFPSVTRIVRASLVLVL